ncbi:unnamed protein product, partial [Ranitomeya imitator]
MYRGINLKGHQKDVSLTAFVLIAMLKSEKILYSTCQNLRSSIEKATNFLLSQYSGLTKTLHHRHYLICSCYGRVNRPTRETAFCNKK